MTQTPQMPSLKRRSFLTQAALAGGALVLPSSALVTSLATLSACKPQVKRRTQHYFLFYFMVGGWDLMLATDPMKQKEGFLIPYDDADIIEHGAHRFGPAMKPLLPHADKMAVLRGIYCDALNHPQARFRMSTGRFKPAGNVVTAPSIQTLLARELGLAYELPNLSSDGMRPATFRGDEPNRLLEPVRVASIEQLKGMVNVRGDIARYTDDIAAAVARKDQLTRKVYDGVDLAADFGEFADLARALAKSDYRKRVGNMKASSTENRWQKQAEMAIEAIRLDVAPVVTVGSGEFDTHTRGEYMSHAAAVIRGFKTVADIATGLQRAIDDDGRTLLDKTTIVITSEFSRTPSRNELGGKHHWPTNAMVLIGKGIRHTKGGPTVFGEVDEGLNHVPVNPRNGSPRNGTEDIDMAHGLATVLAAAGLNPGALIGQDPIADLLA